MLCGLAHIHVNGTLKMKCVNSIARQSNILSGLMASVLASQSLAHVRLFVVVFSLSYNEIKRS